MESRTVDPPYKIASKISNETEYFPKDLTTSKLDKGLLAKIIG